MLSLLVLLAFTGIALAFSAMALNSLEPVHIGIAIALWSGVVWYFRFRGRVMRATAQVQAGAGSAAFSLTPSVLGIVVASFAVPLAALEWAGWLQRSNIWFLYLVSSASLAIVALGFLVVVRGSKQLAKRASSTTQME